MTPKKVRVTQKTKWNSTELKKPFAPKVNMSKVKRQPEVTYLIRHIKNFLKFHIKEMNDY